VHPQLDILFNITTLFIVQDTTKTQIPITVCTGSPQTTPFKVDSSCSTSETSAPMAAKGSTAVGSAQWICTEKENVLDLLQQEQEELIYPAQHEMEWLNEHMAEIFSRNQL
jgi:hypothetical protein